MSSPPLEFIEEFEKIEEKDAQVAPKKIDTSKITYDFEMGGGRWHHCIPIKNDTDGPIQLKNLSFESNADITNPGPLLAPYWQYVLKTKDEKRNVYTYTLAFDPVPLTLPKGKTDLLQYDISNTLGPMN